MVMLGMSNRIEIMKTTNKRLKVLVIDEWFPWPLESGKKIRTFNLISRLAQRYEIYYLAYASIPKEDFKVAEMQKYGINTIFVEDTRTKKWSLPFYMDVARNLLSSQPFSTIYHVRPIFVKELCNFLEREKPDLVHCEWTNYAPYLEYVRNIPIIIASHNIESDIWQRYARNTKNPLSKIVAMQQAKKIEALEREWYAKVDHVIAVSEADKARIEAYGGYVTVVDNGVDLEYYGAQDISKDADCIVYTASFDTFANQDAVHFFMREMYPYIKMKVPNIKVLFVGKDPPPSIVKYGQREPSSILITGTVPDVRKYIGSAAVVIVPLRIGGGSRLKILEAMAMKKPVVSTTVGAEGLMVESGKNIIIADDPIAFSNRVITLVKDERAQNELGKAGWRVVKEMYDWDVLARKQDAVWDKFGKSQFLGRVV